MKVTALLAAGLLALQAILSPLAFALAEPSQSNTVSGFVVPNEVGANEPFTFAATNVVSGEVITINTVEGEVVQTKKADKLGRVFLPAGLAAGAYLLSAKGGKSTSSLNIQPPRNLPAGNGLTVPQMPGCVDAKQGFSFGGEGMNPNAANMMVKVGKTQFPVLAGTATEMKTGPLPNGACGEGPLTIQNTETGEVSMLDSIVYYNLSAKLSQQTVAGGGQTTLEFTFKPANFTANVNVQILGGPVSLPGGAQQMDFMVINGTGKLPLHANPSGQGPFKVAYDINEILGAGKLDGSTFLPVKAGAQAGQLGKAAAGGEPGQAGGALGGLSGAGAGAARGNGRTEPAGNEKKKRCPKEKHIRDEATGWEQSEKKVVDPATNKEKTIYIISRTVRCNIHKSCSKDEGHGGACVFTGKNRCKDHDITETREFDNEQDRKDSMKETAIPEKIKYPA